MFGGSIFGGASIKCGKCGKGLQTEALVIGDQFYHPSCLKCNDCSKQMAQTCFEVESKVMCKPCFDAKYLPKCDRCKKPIDGQMLDVLGKQYHEKCLPLCHRCQKAPGDRQYVDSGGKPSCLECFWIGVKDERRKKVQEKQKAAPPVAIKSK